MSDFKETLRKKKPEKTRNKAKQSQRAEPAPLYIKHKSPYIRHGTRWKLLYFPLQSSKPVFNI